MKNSEAHKSNIFQKIYKDVELISHDLKGYPHYMLKEIEEIDNEPQELISEIKKIKKARIKRLERELKKLKSE